MKLYKFRSIENLEYLFDILINQRLYCSEYQFLNDPFEGTYISKKSNPFFIMVGQGFAGQGIAGSSDHVTKVNNIDDLVVSSNKKRICSLSSSYSDVRLWSFYASSHSGVAVEIDFSNNLDDIYEVKYLESFPEFGNTILTAPSVEQVLSCKTNHWKYENEIRIITDNLYYSIENRIKRIVLGHRIKDDHIEILKRVTNGSVDFVHTAIDYDSIQMIS